MNIEKELQEYRQNLSRLKSLREELFLLISPEFFPDAVSYYNSQIFDKPMISKTNKFYSITENSGIKLEGINKKIQEKINRLKQDIKIIQDKIWRIDILLEKLNGKELFIINCRYILQNSWIFIAIEYQKKYRERILLEDVKKKHRKILEKMKGVLK